MLDQENNTDLAESLDWEENAFKFESIPNYKNEEDSIFTEDEIQFMKKFEIIFQDIQSDTDKKLLIEKFQDANTLDNEDAINKARKFFPDLKATFDDFLGVMKNVLNKLATDKRTKFIPSEEQLRCLLSRSKRQLIDSGAGTGKTTTITLKQFIEQNVFKYKDGDILSFTYTRAGAEAMIKAYDRVSKIFGTSNYVQYSTIHKYSKDLVAIFENDKRKELPTDGKVTITTFDYEFDDEYEEYVPVEVEKYVDAYDIMWEAVDKAGLKEDINKAGFVLHHQIGEVFNVIPVIKELMIKSDEEFKNIEFYVDFPLSYNDLKLLDEEFKKKKYEYNLIDFGDMLEIAVDLLEKIANNELQLTDEQRDYVTFKSIYIDEAQDTSPLQSYIIDLLLKINPDANLVCIGDTDQSIYSFRGGDVRFMLDFPRKHLGKDLDIIYMTRNRRSASHIIELSNGLIQNNKMRLPRVTRGLENSDKPCNIKYVYNHYNILASEYVYKITNDLIEQGSGDLSNTAILFREHRQVVNLVNRLIINKIPFKYNLPNSSIYYNFKVSDVLYKLALFLQNPKDVDFTKDILNVLFDFDQNTINQIAYTMRQGKTLSEILTGMGQTKIIQTLSSLFNLFKNNCSTFEIFSYLENNALLKADSSFTAFKEILQMFENMPFRNFVNRVSEDHKWVTNNSNMGIGVTLSTFHSSKGLEWKNVFIMPLSDSITPNKSKLDKLNNQGQLKYIEEERRLLYVAITRAINNLVIFYNNSITNNNILSSKLDDDMFISELKKVDIPVEIV